MGRRTLHVCVRPFCKGAIGDIVSEAVEHTYDDRGLPAQVRYLEKYLQHPSANAKTIVHETPYVDRHYVEEFTGYYASSFDTPPSKTHRVHFFAREFDEAWFTEALGRAARDGPSGVADELQHDYLGYVVIRPIASCPIGRTLLRPYEGPAANVDGDRVYASTTARVHLCGLELEVRAVPFQQQDVGVGACATTALWAALSQALRADGGRAPTPLAVAHAASYLAAETRQFPAVDGLSLHQMIAAIRHFGFAPHRMNAMDAPLDFVRALQCYLRSRIPVLLVAEVLSRASGSTESESHAVTAVGIREATPRSAGSAIDGTGVAVVPGKIERVYLHDDRLGPYARANLELDGGSVLLSYKGTDVPLDVEEQPLRVQYAIAPLYPKLRLSALDLRKLGESVVPALIRHVDPSAHGEVRFDASFVHGGRYLESLLRSSQLDAERRAQMARTLALPRYVGVLRYWVGDALLADVLCDTTDIHRGEPRYAALLACLCADASMRDDVLKTFKEAGASLTVY